LKNFFGLNHLAEKPSQSAGKNLVPDDSKLRTRFCRESQKAEFIVRDLPFDSAKTKKRRAKLLIDAVTKLNI
jgi:hypothetical protein